MIWTLIQVVVDLILVAASLAMWWRLRRPPQDDPRLSRGLQLLQTKITVLEDLSDRTEAQVKQLSSLLDHKTRAVQNKILEAEQQMMKIDHSMTKSMEVAEIFQDKIPHQEILERQRTVEYVKAARMAHSGLSADEIAKTVHLPREQIELIAKFNRDQLMFDENQLPEWATRPMENGNPGFAMSDIDFITQMDAVPSDPNRSDINNSSVTGASKIENDFRQAVQTARAFEANPPPSIMDSKVAETLRASVASGMETMQPAMMSIRATAQTFKDKLVSTAEDLLRAQAANHGKVTMSESSTPTGTKGTNLNRTSAPMIYEKSKPVIKLEAGVVKKVIFPKLERGP